MAQNPKKLSYIMVTAAHNEEEYIERTISSVLSQTILPKRWMILSDGSTDHTDEIIKRYAAQYDWITYYRMPIHMDRQFAAKANCINTGYQLMKNIDFEIIGNVDADISFENDHLEFILERFSENPKLGIIGTVYIEDSIISFKHRFHKYTDFKHVPGQCQIFRRECFEAIKGYMPIREGGIDTVAVIMAQKIGWRTYTFTEKVFIHHRKMGTGKYPTSIACFMSGKRDYILGDHPLWEAFKAVHRMKKSPYVIGGIILILGYFWAFLTRTARPLAFDAVAFHRRQQLRRLLNIFYTIFK